MRANRMKSLLAALAAAVLISTACRAGPAASPSPDPLAGTYNASGGGGALPPVQALTKRFTEIHPGVVWTIDNVGSEASVVLAANGNADFGFISRDLKNEEKGKVDLLRIGATGTAVVVNSANKVAALTKQQVADIFAGKITDWKAVGADPGDIKIFVREANSSTRSSFEEYFFSGKPVYCKCAIEVVEIEETIKAIAAFKNSIGMVTLAQRALSDPNLKLPAIDDIPATLASLSADKWPIRRPLYIVYAPDANKRKPVVDSFLAFVKSADGQKILAGF